MTSGANHFPSGNQLWRGAILSTVAHAVWEASHDFSLESVAWDDTAYLVSDSQGTVGVVLFGDDSLVGLFKDTESSRTPWQSSEPYNVRWYVDSVPATLQSMVTRGLAHMIDTWQDFRGPVVTACFWSTGERLEAAEPWTSVIEHGAHAIAIETSATDDEALVALEEDMEMTPTQLTLAYALFMRRMTAAVLPVAVQPWERALLTADGEAGIRRSRELLAAVGLVL